MDHPLPEAVLAALNVAGEKNPGNSLEIFKKAARRSEPFLQCRGLYWLARRYPDAGMEVFTGILETSQEDLRYPAAAALTLTRQNLRGWKILQSGLQNPLEQETKALQACLDMEIDLPTEILEALLSHSFRNEKAVTACSFHRAPDIFELLMDALKQPALSKIAFEALMTLSENLSLVGEKMIHPEFFFYAEKCCLRFSKKEALNIPIFSPVFFETGTARCF